MAVRFSQEHSVALGLFAAALYLLTCAAASAGQVHLTRVQARPWVCQRSLGRHHRDWQGDACGEQGGASRPLQLFCASTGGAQYFPVPVTAAAVTASSGGLPIGPLLAGEALACVLTLGGAPGNQTACTASFLQLQSPVACPAANSVPSYQLQCTGCTPPQQGPPPPPAPVLCSNHTSLTSALGSFTDGAPTGGQYSPGSTCAWLVAPGYTFLRLNFTRFDTEEGFDYVYVIAVYEDGRNEVLQKLSGGLAQVRTAASSLDSRPGRVP